MRRIDIELGTDATDAKRALGAFERLLKIFEQHLHALNREIPAALSPP
jgi:hypothetical protein